MIDWNDNAKAAVKAYDDWAGNESSMYISYIDEFMQGVTQTKTVADAYEWCNEWKSTFELLFWQEGIGFIYKDVIEGLEGQQFICTREQFEAYVKEKEYPKDKGMVAEQESEKWTHTFSGGDCRIIVNEPDAQGDIVIMSKKGSYLTPPAQSVIPKSISKIEYDAIVNFAESSCEPLVTMKAEEYLAGREII